MNVYTFSLTTTRNSDIRKRRTSKKRLISILPSIFSLEIDYYRKRMH